MKQLRRYLQVASVSNNGTLICRKSNPYGRDLELIIVPQGIVSGLMAALHIRFGHPLKSQMKKFGIDVTSHLKLINILMRLRVRVLCVCPLEVTKITYPAKHK